MLDDADLTRILRYVSGESSPEEAAEAARWIGDDPARARATATLERLWARGDEARAADAAGVATWDVDAAWRQVRETKVSGERTRRVPTLELIPADAGRRRWRWVRAMGAAAAVLALAFAARPVWRSIASSGGVTPLAGRDFTTAAAQRAEIRLSDGTLVVLAPESRLRMLPRYGVEARELELEGEAYFDVRHDAAKPFRVRTARGVAEDVGTKFGVRSYRADSIERVAVTEGTVTLRSAVAGSPAVTLTAGKVGTLAASGAPVVTDVVDVDRYVAWTEGRLVFRDVPLREVATQIERWYALDVRVSGAGTSSLLFSGSFRTESVAEVIRSLEVALDLTARRSGDTVTLSRRAPAP